MAITSKDLHAHFRSELIAAVGSDIAQRCFECGSCSGVCPVGRAEPSFDPRKILHMLKFGLREQLLSSKMIWACSHCDSCSFICPQGIRFSDILSVLRRMAIDGGYADPKCNKQWATSPCKASCPAHISIPGFITAISQGLYAEGLQLIKRELPLPAICGRVCPHPCEAGCSRNQVDQPLAIMHLKRFLADFDYASGTPYIPPRKPARDEKIAVIGSGPAGLTVAYYLAIEGYWVTVFEKLPVPGGMMVVGIPEYRLPRSVIQQEIAQIEQLGVEFRLNCEIGKDLHLPDLRREFQAVFIGVGCHRGLRLGIPGENDVEEITDGAKFLRDFHLGVANPMGNRIVVVGGGNVAIDCARVAKRLGKKVTVLYRRTRQEMPAYPWEVQEAIEEEIEFQYLTAPVRILGEKSKIAALQCVRMELGAPDESGRRRPIPIEGSEFTVEADHVLVAIGQVSDLSFADRDIKLEISRKSLVKADPSTGETNIPGIYAGGDSAHGPRTVVEAIASGKRAAWAIHRYLNGKPVSTTFSAKWEGLELAAPMSRTQSREMVPCIALHERLRSFKEIELGFSEAQAKQEASRCFRICGMQK